MKQKKMKCALAMLTAVSLLLPALPGMGTEVHAAEPDVTKFATKDQLTTSFGLDDVGNRAVGRIKFGLNGANNREWLIAGLDTANNDTLALLSASSFGAEGYGLSSKYSESLILTKKLPGYLEGTAYFSESEKGYMAETTVSTLEYDQEDGDTPRAMTSKLYLPDAKGRNVKNQDEKKIYVGTKNNLPIALNKLNVDNVTNNFFWLRSPQEYGSNGVVLSVNITANSVVADHVANANAVVPAFNLNLSSVLFASAAPAASSDGALTTEAAMTLRYDAGLSLGSAAINPAQGEVSVSGAPEGTYLVVQNDSGAWAKAVSGDSIISASDMNAGLASFAGCKVWLEKTDTTERITTAAMAVTGYISKIINPPDSHITRSTAAGNGAETQIAAQGTAITDVVYTADSDYYFPAGYSVARVNGITVKRDNAAQITVSGTPAANAEITLMPATEKGEQTAPTGLSDGIGKIKGTNTAMEYAAAADAADWTTCTNDDTVVTAGTWYIRYAETDTEKVSPPTAITVTAPTYTITTTPTELDFGIVNPDDKGSYTRPAAQTVTVTNTGNSGVTLTKPTSTSYTIGELSKATLGAGESATFTVQPKGDLSAGTYPETLEVTTDKGTKAEVALSFTVNGAFSVTIDPASAEIIAGQRQTLTANPEGGSGNYTYAWYAGSETEVIETDKEVTVSPTTTTTYKVVVKDTIEDKEATATVTVIQATHTITADPAALNFGTVNLDDKGSYTQPATQTVKVMNTGNSAVTLTKPDSTSYVIGELSRATLGAGESATFTVQPKGDLVAGTYSETLEVKTNEGTKTTVVLSFTVNGAFFVTIDPASAEIIAGQSQTLTANPKGGSGNYTYAWYAGSETEVIETDKEVAVSPTTTTTYKVVVKDTIEDKEATVTVTVIPATHTITADPAALNFGTVNLNDKSSYTQPEAKTVEVTNTGNSAVTLTKPDSTSYIIGELSKATLGAGESATFTVQPKGDLVAGTYSETLEVKTNEGTKAKVALSFTVRAKSEDAPKIIKGADSKWTKGSKDGLSFTSNAKFDRFKKVMIDGKDIDASHYSVQSGSTIVTLKAEYLETQKEGKHTISIVSENGAADAAFTIVKGADKPAPDKTTPDKTTPDKTTPDKTTPSNSGTDTKVPQTGDNSNIALWFILLVLCGGTIAVISIRKKRI